MNRLEFLNECEKITLHDRRIDIDCELSNNAYSIIEYVYTWHPCIDAVKGKQQIALLYTEFGMRIILDMASTAENAEKLEQELGELKARENRVKKALQELLHPDKVDYSKDN